MSRLYLDNNSTTPMLPEVAEAMARYQLDHVGNPASAHRRGAMARTALEAARSTVARCLGAHPDEVVFTSGATEANNLALFGLAADPDIELAYSDIEHPSVIEPCRVLTQRGARVHQLAVDGAGYVLSETLPVDTKEKALVAIQLANHETGTVQDMAMLRQRCPLACFHTDATQAIGKIPVNFHLLGVSTLAGSAHKFHGPCGIGILLISRCIKLAPRIFGGHQQQGVRPGTEPVALTIGMATALQLAVDQMEERQAKCRGLRQLFLQHLQTRLGPIIINGDAGRGLPHTLNLAFPGCPNELLFIRLDLAGIDCSTGSACASGSLLPSPVLQAMKKPDAVLTSSMRFSLSHLLTEKEVIEAADRIASEVQSLRSRV